MGGRHLAREDGAQRRERAGGWIVGFVGVWLLASAGRCRGEVVCRWGRRKEEEDLLFGGWRGWVENLKLQILDNVSQEEMSARVSR